MKTMNLLVLTTLMVACSSPKTKDHRDLVIGRIDELPERPFWFKESIESEEAGDRVIFWGRSTLKNNERLEIGYKIAELNAKSKIANYVSEKIKTISQSADEVGSQDQSLFRSIITQKAKVDLSEIQSGQKYWEKVQISDPQGERRTEYRVFSSVVIKKQDLSKLVKNALQEGEGKFSENFSKKVDEEFEQMMGEDQHEIR